MEGFKSTETDVKSSIYERKVVVSDLLMQRLIPYLRTSRKTTVSSIINWCWSIKGSFPLKQTKLEMMYAFIVHDW